MSSIRSSLDELSVMVAWTRINPCSTRSLSSTRTTPIGILVSAAHLRNGPSVTHLEHLARGRIGSGSCRPRLGSTRKSGLQGQVHHGLGVRPEVMV